MKKQLSTRISFIVAIMVLLGMTALIAVAALLSAKSVSAGTNGELSELAKQNSVQIQSMLNEAAEAANGLRSFAVSNYSGIAATEKKTSTSAVYSTVLSSSCKAIETYAIESGWRLVQSSESLVGLGIFFEPYAFDSSIDKYAIYIDETMAADKSVSMYANV